MIGQIINNIDKDPRVQEALCKLEQMRCQLQALSWSQMLEFGMVKDPEVVPHNFAGTPYILSGDSPIAINFMGNMGKPSTRGHVKNRGDSEIDVAFYTMDKQWSSEYRLSPGDVLDFSSFAVLNLRLSVVADPIAYTVFAQ